MAVRPDIGEPSARMPFPRRVWQRWSDATEPWRGGMMLGVATALTIWVVWYFTKPPCTPDNVAAGLCNGGWLARYINAEILVLAGGAGIAVATLKGGFDTYMLKDMLRQEREARQRAEQELEKERAARHTQAEQERDAWETRIDQERDAWKTQVEQELEKERAARHTQADERHDELRAEFHQFVEQYRQAEEQRLQVAEQRRQAEQEERRQLMSIQQAMLDTIVQLAQQRNGGGNRNGNGPAAGE